MAARSEPKAETNFVWPPVAPGDGGREPVVAPVGPASRTPGVLAKLVAQGEWAWVGSEPPAVDRLAGVRWRDAPELVCPRCAGDVGLFEADADGCPACRSRRLAWREAVRLGPYADELRECVLELKFTRRRPTGVILGRWLGEAIAARLTDHGLPPNRALIVPVPTTRRRRMARGIDHSAVLARSAACASGAAWGRLLTRRSGRPQTSVPASRRLRNVAGAFKARSARAVAGEAPAVVVVVDDVRTTGATMTAACRALRSGMRAADWACPVWSAVVGVTPARDRAKRPAGKV